MTRPRTLQRHEWSGMTYEERRTYSAELAAWRATPEGQLEVAQQNARDVAAFEQERIKLATQMFCDTDAEPGYQIGLPPRAVEIVLAGPQATVAIEAVHGAEDICILLGAPGTGKTIAAVARVHEYLFDVANWSKHDPREYQTRPYFRRPRPIWRTAGQLARIDHYKQAEIDRVGKVPLLVIDDLGAEFNDSKGFFASLLDEVIDLRYSSRRSTIITSNLAAPGFAARYGVRIVDRIREGGRFVGCGAESLRRRPGS